jgi:hypothetical protein
MGMTSTKNKTPPSAPVIDNDLKNKITDIMLPTTPILIKMLLTVFPLAALAEFMVVVALLLH